MPKLTTKAVEKASLKLGKDGKPELGKDGKPKRYRLSDGGGLLLEVLPTGGKLWFCRTTIGGKRKDIGLGGFPAVSLADARDRAAEIRKKAKAGIDPIAERAATKAAAEAAQAAAAAAEAAKHEHTFKALALRYIAGREASWKSPKQAPSWRATLEQHAFPVLGDMPIAAVDRAAVLRAITPVWTGKPAMAEKVLVRIAVVLRFAAALGLRVNDNPADPKMLYHAGLPERAGAAHRPALPWSRMSAFMAALNAEAGVSPIALRFTILTCVRSGEARGARWSELSFDPSPTWTIPAARMKGRKSATQRPHRVPLSGAALDCIAGVYSMLKGEKITAADLPRIARLMGDALIFPNIKGEVLSDMALSSVIRRMNAVEEGEAAPWRDAEGREVVPHGFRASFRTWVADTRPEDGEAAEAALAHEIGSKVTRAYARSDAFTARVELMAAWAAHCTAKGDTGEVLPLMRRASVDT